MDDYDWNKAMKKMIVYMILVAILLMNLMACGKSDAVTETTPTGTAGWEITPAQTGTLPEDAQTAFDKAIVSQDGVNYIPVALLSTQIVSGKNYCIFCQVKNGETEPFWALVYIYEDLQGNAEITNVYDLDIPRHFAPAK